MLHRAAVLILFRLKILNIGNVFHNVNAVLSAIWPSATELPSYASVLTQL